MKRLIFQRFYDAWLKEGRDAGGDELQDNAMLKERKMKQHML